MTRMIPMPLRYGQLASDPQVQLFCSFSSYGLPKQHTEPISWEQTEGLSSFCLVRYQENHLVESFAKVLLQRVEEGQLPWPQPTTPGTVLYALARSGQQPGFGVPYQQTLADDE